MEIAAQAYRAIPAGGLLAGILDITAACITNGLKGRSPLWVFQSVASGLLGRSSFQGGYKTAVWGLALHFFIATTATAVFYFASRRLRFLVQRPVVAGLLYGTLVYLFMYFVVIPLSAIGRNVVATPGDAAVGWLTHLLCVGLPIALTVRRYANNTA